MIASERKLYIMKSLNQKGIINLKDIARELDISEITVRRDFEKLEKEGRLKRVQGGAALENLLDNAEPTAKEKSTQNLSEKRRVAQFAADYVHDGDCVFIDSGSSMVPLMSALENKHIRIVTYNNLLMKSSPAPTAAELFIVGGRYIPFSSMNVGPIAQKILRQFHFDIAFLGCASLDVSNGICYETEMESLLMKQIAMENSDKKYLLIDSSKLEKQGFLQFTKIDCFDEVFCDKPQNEKYVGVNNLTFI
ncbi:MAG: DeoR/GlpR family DNA-binding transcription regulator [Christensenella sp.]|nr:DeoR/GlpR family DNA-binding transcription regulator [Christensenella sp.]